MDLKEILERSINIRINSIQDISSTDPEREYYLGQNDAYSEVLRILGDITEETRYVIEKELLNPKGGEIQGPRYHLYRVSEENGKELLKTFSGDITLAARELERQKDLLKLEMAYKENPSSLLSNTPPPFDDKMQGVLCAGKKYAEEHEFLGRSEEELYLEFHDGKVKAFCAGVLWLMKKLGIKEIDLNES